MAKSTFKYCSHRDVKDVYPNIDDSDSKTRLFTFTEQDAGQTTNNDVDMYIHPNSGLVTNLYRDNNDLGSGKQTIATSQISLIDEELTIGDTRINVANYVNFVSSHLTYIKIDDEIMYVTDVQNSSPDYIDVVRGRLGTTATTHTDATPAYQHFMPSSDGQWLYDSDNDFVVMSVTNTTNPTDNLMEAGEDWATLIDRMIVNCSMEVSAMLDARFPRPIPKSFQYAKATDGSDEPEYDYILVRATALLVVHHLLVSKSPMSEEAMSFKEELDNIVEKLNKGTLKLGFEIDSSDTSGDIIEVKKVGSMQLAETSGEWYGQSYDRLKLKCTRSGVYGYAKVDISYYGNGKIYGSTKEGVLVNGALQDILLGLWVRFEGNSMTINDEWHIVVRNFSQKNSNSGIRSIRATSSDNVNKLVIRKDF
jgi:hypothetical protein